VAGRFLSVDPMADQGEHPYTYAGADPVNGHDPTGQQEVIDYSLEEAYFVPPAALFIGMEENIECLAEIELSELATPEDQIKKAEACKVAAAGKGKPKDGPPRPKPPKPVATDPCGFIRLHWSEAVDLAKTLKVPPEFVMAVSADESYWGTSNICQSNVANNFFGIHAGAPGALPDPYWTDPPPPDKPVAVSRFPGNGYVNSGEAFVAIETQWAAKETNPEEFFKKIHQHGYGTTNPHYVTDMMKVLASVKTRSKCH